jgi:hypothetical protein
VPKRAKAMLLSLSGYTRIEIAVIFKTRLDTVSGWFNTIEANRE